MIKLGWGKPRIFVKDIEDTAAKWIEINTPVQDSTKLDVKQGNKEEAKIEGGANEAVRYEMNTYSLTYNIREAKGRTMPIPHVDGLVKHQYAVMVQPEDATVPGISIAQSTVTIQDTYVAKDGFIETITHDAVKPDNGDRQVKHGLVTVGTDGQPTFVEDTDEPTSDLQNTSGAGV